jgi:hypothetical protein
MANAGARRVLIGRLPYSPIVEGEAVQPPAWVQTERDRAVWESGERQRELIDQDNALHRRRLERAAARTIHPSSPPKEAS